MKRKGTIIFFIALLLNWTVAAQTDRQLERQTNTDTKTVKRIALVIGNGAYTKAKPLPNPSNDAADMAKALQELGFEVISGVNQNKRQMETLIREFGTKLANSGGVGLFYYAGHGIQVAGENYLVPVDADIPEEDEVAYSAVPISLILGKMQTAKNDLNIIILDACRNNPFARSWRSFRDSGNNNGLAKISPPTGTLVLYATEPGKVASDGAGRNGLFTEALLKQIKQPNLEYDKMVKALSADVWQRSNKQQLPWKEGNTLQDFYFVESNVNKNSVQNIPPKETTVEIKKTTPATIWAGLRNTARNLLKYDSVSSFEDNLALVRIGNYEIGKYGFIDKTGKEIIPLIYNDADSFSEGLARVRIGDDKTGKHGFIDNLGKIVIPIKYDDASRFSEGVAAVKLGGRQTGKWGFIDKTDKEIIPFKYNVVLVFSEGLVAVRIGDYKTGKYGFIDKTGKEIIPAKYDSAGLFSEGLAAISIGDWETGKHGFIDKTGRVVIPVKYSDAFRFIDGLAEVKIGDWKTGKRGFIDKTDKEIIPAKYDFTGIFYKGLVEVRIGDWETGKWGFIDKIGNEVIPIKYDSVWCYAFKEEGFYGVILNGKKGFVDTYGNEYFDF